MSADSALQNMSMLDWSQRDSVDEKRRKTRTGYVRPEAIIAFHT